MEVFGGGGEQWDIVYVWPWYVLLFIFSDEWQSKKPVHPMQTTWTLMILLHSTNSFPITLRQWYNFDYLWAYLFDFLLVRTSLKTYFSSQLHRQPRRSSTWHIDPTSRTSIDRIHHRRHRCWCRIHLSTGPYGQLVVVGYKHRRTAGSREHQPPVCPLFGSQINWETNQSYNRRCGFFEFPPPSTETTDSQKVLGDFARKSHTKEIAACT